MASNASVVEMTNVVIDKDKSIVFFQSNNLAYNWKTQQWTRQPAWSGTTYYALNGGPGLIRFSGNAVDLQDGSTNGVEQTATITTGAVDANQGGRTVVTGVRPLANGGTHTVRVGVQDNVGDAVTWSTSTSPNSRTGMANFRAEGRYVRIENTITGGFTTAMGADIEFSPRGKV